MAASQTTIALRNSTDGEFQAIGAFIYAGLIAGGWTRVYADFGANTSWSDVVKPAQNTYGVVEIWKSPDEVGLTNFYLKLRHGSSNNVAPAYALAWSASWAYSGSGSSLGGTPSTEVTSIASNIAASATTRRCTIAAGAGYIALCLGGGAANEQGHHLFTLERTRDSNIEPQNELASLFHYSASGSLSGTHKVYTEEGYEWVTGVVAAGSATSWYAVSLTAAQQVSRGKVGPMLMTPWKGPITSPLTTFMGTTVSTLGEIGEQITIPVYGVNRNYMLLGTTSGAPGAWASNKNGIILFD